MDRRHRDPQFDLMARACKVKFGWRNAVSTKDRFAAQAQRPVCCRLYRYDPVSPAMDVRVA